MLDDSVEVDATNDCRYALQRPASNEYTLKLAAMADALMLTTLFPAFRRVQESATRRKGRLVRLLGV